ncbi:MAG: hypothetical protein Q9220_002262 [cf. Caloplaca sp. 1 TL-2023]
MAYPVVGLFTAESAHNCLISTSFNATVATQFLSYYKDTLQFQSTLAYLKTPPSTYRQPSIDLLGALDDVQRAVNSGVYKNEYDFEAAVQKLVYATHDAHIILYAGALSVFTFGAPVSIVSVSTDGVAYPKVFILDDLLEAYDPANKVDWIPSAISSINGVTTVDFLRGFAASNSPGTLEPHADWNQLMSSPANDIQSYLSTFEGSTPFWPGNDITFAFENGTEPLSLPWVATYTIPDDTPLITSGNDFYQIFVLGNSPDVEDDPSVVTASLPTASATASASAEATFTSTATATADPTGATALATAAADPAEDQATSWNYFPYPSNPVTVQPNLGNGGVVTGYFLNDGVTAVLSIPSFDVNSESIVSFSDAVGEFIQKSKDAGKERFIIDLQHNGGGGNLLATDTFKQFFPSIDPFAGSRLRAHEGANALGNTFSAYYNSQSSNSTNTDPLIGSPWVAGTFINADTGRNFSSWAELYGPQVANGDFFTKTQRDNLSSIVFDETAGGIVVSGFGNRSAALPQPYDAKNIILLSDGTCSSACANFIELMHHQAGVRTVVAGGLPEAGPMQIPSGSRGAEVYTSFALDADISFASSINATSASSLPQNRDIDFYITYAGFNLKDAVRKDDPTPLQFQNEPADCRIFYTVHTVYNFENLWNYVIDAMWRNPSLCIAGSASPFAPSNAPNPSSSQKRSLIPPPEPNLSTFENDFTFTPTSSECPICPNARQACTDVPFCSRGRRTFTKKCRLVCVGGFSTSSCGPDAHCSETRRGVRGSCQLNADITAARGCPATPTAAGQKNVQQAAAGVGTGPYDFPTSGRRVGNNVGRGGIPTGGGGRGGGTAGFVDLAFGRGG